MFLNTQIEKQVSADKVETDVVVLQTIQDLVGWNTRGLLLHFKPDEFRQFRVTMRDKDGAWIALNTNPAFYAYNTDSVRMEDVPTSAIDFLKVYFKGKLISAYPADDDATLYAFHTIVKKYGWGYMRPIPGADAQIRPRSSGVARSSRVKGESRATFDSTVSSTLSVQREGGRLALLGAQGRFPAGVLPGGSDSQEGAAPQCGEALCRLVSVQGVAKPDGVYSSRLHTPPAIAVVVDRLEDGYLEFLDE